MCCVCKLCEGNRLSLIQMDAIYKSCGQMPRGVVVMIKFPEQPQVPNAYVCICWWHRVMNHCCSLLLLQEEVDDEAVTAAAPSFWRGSSLCVSLTAAAPRELYAKLDASLFFSSCFCQAGASVGTVNGYIFALKQPPGKKHRGFLTDATPTLAYTADMKTDRCLQVNAAKITI